MQNDVLKNEIAPWQEKGRWYHGKVDCVTRSLITSETDQFILDNFSINLASDVIRIASTNTNIRVLDNVVMPSKDLTRYTSSGFNPKGYNFDLTYVIIPIGLTAVTGTFEFWTFIVEL